MDQQWMNRAASAEAAVAKRHLRRLWQLPATQLGVVGWPPTRKDSNFGTWHYWWQAHLLDTLVDAQVRDPRPARVESIKRQIRGHLARNNGRWTNSYYDDMAWLALALMAEEKFYLSDSLLPDAQTRTKIRTALAMMAVYRGLLRTLRQKGWKPGAAKVTLPPWRVMLTAGRVAWFGYP